MDTTTHAQADELDARMQQYSAQGYSRARMLARLQSERFPLDLLKSRFPELESQAAALRQPTPAHLRPAAGQGIRSKADASRTTDPVASATSAPGRASDPRTLLTSNATGDGAQSSVARPGSLTSAPIANLAQQLAARAATAAAAQAVAEEGISFHYVPLIQCSFPHADPGEVTTFTRKNGWLELTLGTTRPDTGLPYGVPARLLTIYCASEAVRTKSPEIFLGNTVHEFLRRLDVPVSRGARGSLSVYANQLLRLIHCTLSIDENIVGQDGRTGLHIRQAVFAEEARLWWDADHAVGKGSSLVLSPTLFHSILDRSAPLSTAAIKALRKSPMDLDVYAWLVHRMFHLSKPSTVSWAQLSGQFGHGYGELRKFRRFFLDSLKRVQKVYPEARLQLTEHGLMLLPSKRHVAPLPKR